MEAHDFIRFKLTVQYDGSSFHGWQVQPDQRTVQGELQAALSRLADSPRTVHGSGRTDTGVHATGQVAVADMPSQWTSAKLEVSVNALLPDEIRVSAVEVVPPDFHPRFDAVARTYTYKVGTTAEALSPFQRRWCWPLGEALDRTLLDSAASQLLGRHSFEAFAKSGQPERGVYCTVAAASWSAWEHGVRLDITADRYLHHMVRYLVGTMVDIARGRREPGELSSLLAGDPVLTTSPPAPPEGLFLALVEYPSATAASDSSSDTPRRSTTQA